MQGHLFLSLKRTQYSAMRMELSTKFPGAVVWSPWVTSCDTRESNLSNLSSSGSIASQMSTPSVAARCPDSSSENRSSSEAKGSLSESESLPEEGSSSGKPSIAAAPSRTGCSCDGLVVWPFSSSSISVFAPYVVPAGQIHGIGRASLPAGLNLDHFRRKAHPPQSHPYSAHFVPPKPHQPNAKRYAPHSHTYRTGTSRRTGANSHHRRLGQTMLSGQGNLIF